MRDQGDVLLREACAMIAQEEADRLERNMTPELKKDAEALYRRHRPTVRMVIARNTKHAKRPLRTVLRAAACAAAAAGILFFALRSPAPDSALVQGTATPILPVEFVSVDVSLAQGENAESGAADQLDWALFPGYIPQGWTLRSEAETENGLTARFSAEEGGAWLQFTQGHGAYLYPVSQAQSASYVRLNGRTVLKVSGAQETTLVWDQDGLTLTMTGDSAAEAELERVAQSVKKVAKP